MGVNKKINKRMVPLPEKLLGVNIHPLSLYELFSCIDIFIDERKKYKIGYVNIHSINLTIKDKEFKKIINGLDIVYCDGYGVLLASKILGLGLPERMTGADWIYKFASHCEKRCYSIYFLGGERGVAERAARQLKAIYPKINIIGTRHGYFRNDSWNEVIEKINAAGPDILLIGLGSPLQEKWIQSYRDNIEAPVCWTIGALFDFISKKTKRGPKWMTEYGMEWVYRFFKEPKRLWKRYLVGNPFFFFYIFREYLLSGKGKIIFDIRSYIRHGKQ